VRAQAGIPEDAYCYTALLKAAARERNPAKTEAIFDRAWEQGIRGAPIFNVLISHQNEQHHTKVGVGPARNFEVLGLCLLSLITSWVVNSPLADIVNNFPPGLQHEDALMVIERDVGMRGGGGGGVIRQMMICTTPSMSLRDIEDRCIRRPV